MHRGGTRGDGVSIAAGLYAKHLYTKDGLLRPGLPEGFGKFTNAGPTEPATGQPFETIHNGRGGATFGVSTNHHGDIVHHGIEDGAVHNIRLRQAPPPPSMKSTKDTNPWENEDKSNSCFGFPLSAARGPTHMLETITSPIRKNAPRQNFLPVHNQTPRGRGHYVPEVGTANANTGSASYSATYSNPEWTANRRPWAKVAEVRQKRC